MEQHFQRAVMLLRQRRFDLAEQELRLVLGEAPTFGLAHSYLSMALLGQERHKDARVAADQAVGLSPDEPYVHSLRSRVLSDCNRFPESEEAAREAIRIDPEDAAHHEALAIALAGRKRWKEALVAADAGLAIDPEDADLLNMRSRLLVLAGRHDEVDAATEQALRAAPNDADSHASAGYMHLNAGNYDKAFEHFREALRIEPESEFAKQGVIQAIHAQNRFYAIVLRYFMWMERLGGKAFFLLIGGWFAMQVLSSMSGSLPPWGQTAATVVLILYALFCVTTWIAWPLFNLLLRFHPFGRLVLSKRQRIESSILGGALSLSVVAFACAFVDGRFLMLGVAIILLSMLFAGSHSHEGVRRVAMLGVLGVAIVLLVSAVVAGWAASGGNADERAGELSVAFVWTVVGGLFLGNLLMFRPERR